MNRFLKSGLILLLGMLPTLWGTLNAQNKTMLKGLILDEEKTAIPYANIYWLGTLFYTISDAEGKFEIALTPQSNRLVVSSSGYLSDTLQIRTPQPLQVVLKAVPMDEVEVLGSQRGRSRSKLSVGHTERINMNELVRAACCSLGESFTTNPSVDVSTTDAATGTKQIKLLGLSGRYVQMQTENIPNFRAVASPFALGYIPGSWIESIQVSKGAASVKNGYESMTGQINIEYKKPNTDRYLEGNLYMDHDLKTEVNLLGNWHLGEKWSTALLTHVENSSTPHDANGDAFIDLPLVRQYNLMNRWTYKAEHTIFQSGILFLDENRRSGQWGKNLPQNPYQVEIANRRGEAFAKVAYILDPETGANVALIVNASKQRMKAAYGWRSLDVTQDNVYASLLYEQQWDEHHGISTGLSWQYDRWNTGYQILQQQNQPIQLDKSQESVPGGYVQYTYTPIHDLTLMAGVRADYSSLHGLFVTPRMHVRYNPIHALSLRASVGKGYRTHNILLENSHFFASGRKMVIASETDRLQESSWNYGLSLGWNIPVNEDKTIDFNAEYFYTSFEKRMIIDWDQDPTAVHFYAMGVDDHSYSHTLQVDASYTLFRDFDLMAAFRYTDVKSTIYNELRSEPLTSLYKGMFSLSYKTPLRLWQGDLTFSVQGGGRMPTPYVMANDKGQGLLSWNANFPAYPLLSAQITRFFPKWSIYVGGENLTNYKQPNPIIGAENPWGTHFDSTMIWGPTSGMMLYVGVRFNLYDND